MYTRAGHVPTFVNVSLTGSSTCSKREISVNFKFKNRNVPFVNGIYRFNNLNLLNDVYLTVYFNTQKKIC